MATMKGEAIKAGWGSADITPRKTAELYGQYYQRIATGVRDPLSVTALAIERPGAGSSGQAIFISCDQAMVNSALMASVREALAAAIPDFDGSRLIASATHTHSAPSSYDSLQWWKHDPAYLSFEDFRVTLRAALVSSAIAAWKGRVPAEIGIASGLASVGHCRRPFYLDGSAEMYGSTNRPDFTGMEGPEDDHIGVMGVWKAGGELTGVLVNVPCPSQVMEATYVVSADMFGEMRRRIRLDSGKDIHVLAQVGAGGDIAPRDLTVPHRDGPSYWDEAGMVELGGRLSTAVLEALPRAERNRKSDPVFHHEALSPRLPLRMVSPHDYAQAVSELAALVAREPADERAPESAYSRFVKKTREREKLPVPGPFDDKNDDFVLMRNLEAVTRRFEVQRIDPKVTIEVHILRIGDTALSTSPFELYVDYAMRIRARSPAKLSFHAQLSCDAAGYLPTERAVAAGGYGALIANGSVGPEGGQMLVEMILEAYDRLFAD
ncbi:MAG: hypothetical protein ACOYM2_02620 [Rectinemataceae bacterium]